MFNQYIRSVQPLSRQARRLAVVASRTAGTANQRNTHRNATVQLNSAIQRQRRQQQQQHRQHGRTASLHYDQVDDSSGASVIQTRFDALVREALLTYGPPLPPEFVLDNNVVTSAGDTDARTASFGADGSSFVFYDEVALRPSELLEAIRRAQPGFSVREDCDGVPFSLLVKNCSYLRAHGGRIHFMRHLSKAKRTSDDRPSLVVSLSKYKLREAPSVDGIRTGPQPWKYSARFV